MFKSEQTHAMVAMPLQLCDASYGMPAMQCQLCNASNASNAMPAMQSDWRLNGIMRLLEALHSMIII